MLSFDYSGKSGVSGASGSHGSCGFMGMRGQDGSDGMRGTDGYTSTNIELIMRVDTNMNNKLILNELNQRAIYDNLILGDENNKVNLIANGGHGGHGGYGGDGGRGGDGMSGRDATRGSSGTNGQPGGNGGDGGDGGDGGSGGDGGVINVAVDPQDMDLLMIVDQVSYKAGLLGSGGSGGSGGAGGFGGRGGSSYHWSETSNGTTHHYSNPGGFSGPPGFPGRSGQRGRDGRTGRDGTFSYSVGGSKYSSRYDLKVDKVCAVVSDDGIIEPGETLQINAMDVMNIGGMHTPVAQRIALYLQNNKWIFFNPMNQIYMENSINVSNVFKITDYNPLIFKINDFNETTSDAVFKSTAVVDYRARVERVNKEFKTVADQTNQYPVRFPVEMSQVQLLRSITFREESPFAISIFNRSTKPLGINHNRLLNFRLMLTDTRQTVDFVPKFMIDQQKDARNLSEWGQKARKQENYIDPKHHEDVNYVIEQDFITTIAPGEKKIISGTIKLKDLNLPLYTNIRMQAKLDLGHFHNQNTLYQNIQTRNFHIQLTEGHDAHPNSDFLLVFNCDTPSVFIDSMKKFAQDFGTNVDLWNISNYQGFNYDYIGPLDKTLYSIYKDKVVIILANEYSLINSDKTNAIRQIREPHIYKSVKDYNINTYILGPCSGYNEFWLIHPNLEADNSVHVGGKDLEFYKRIEQDIKDKNQAEELKIDDENLNKLLGSYLKDCAYTLNYHQGIACCSNPSSEKVLSKAQGLLKKVDLMNPLNYHLMNYSYKPEIIKKGTFSTEYHMGDISMVESLRRDHASLIMRNRQQFNETILDQVDRFCLIKLLPFNKKLQYLERTMKKYDDAVLVLQSIVADLCDEYIAFSKQDLNNLQLQERMTKWSEMLTFNFVEALKPADPSKRKTKIGREFQSDPGQTPNQQFYPAAPTMQFQSEPMHQNAGMPPPPPAGAQCFDGQCPPPPGMMAMPPNGNYDYPTNNDSINAGQNSQESKEYVKDINVVEKQDKIEININMNSDEVMPNFQIMTNQDQQGMYIPPPQIGITIDTPQEPYSVETDTKDIETAQRVKSFFVDYLIKLRCAMRKQLSFGQKCCCSATAKVNAHCCTLIDALLLRKLSVPQNEIDATVQAYNREIELKDKADVFAVYQVPHKAMNLSRQRTDFVKQNNLFMESQIYSVRDFPVSNFNKDEKVYIQDGSFIFFNDNTQELQQEKRVNKITTFENQILFDKD